MRYLLCTLIFLIGCSANEPQPTITPFKSLEYRGLSSLNLAPQEVASYLFSISTDYDFFSTLAPVSSSNSTFLFRQCYHDVPIWDTEVEITWNTNHAEAGRLLVVSPSLLKGLEPTDLMSEEDALSKLESIFLAHDQPDLYEILEPRLVYYYHPLVGKWFLAWETCVDSHHSDYDQFSKTVRLATLRYTIIIDQEGNVLLMRQDQV